MKKPPENFSVEATALRKAAIAWAHHTAKESDDREGNRLNRALMFAAIRYAARVVTGLGAAESVKFNANATDSWLAFMRGNRHAFARTIRRLARVV